MRLPRGSGCRRRRDQSGCSAYPQCTARRQRKVSIYGLPAVGLGPTKVELMVFRYLRRQKIYFQKHYKRASGAPDIALPRKKKAVFIDGDFWHGREYEGLLRRHGADHFWTKKIAGNIERDTKVRTQLVADGWQVYQVWESDLNRIRTRDETLKGINDFLIGLK